MFLSVFNFETIIFLENSREHLFSKVSAPSIAGLPHTQGNSGQRRNNIIKEDETECAMKIYVSNQNKI